MTATRAPAAYSMAVKLRPARMSPPFTWGQLQPKPAILTSVRSTSRALTGPSVYSPTFTSRTAGSWRISSASSTVISGIRRHGESSSEPSEISSPPDKYRVTKNVLGPADSRMSVMLRLIPVIAERHRDHHHHADGDAEDR